MIVYRLQYNLRSLSSVIRRVDSITFQEQVLTYSPKSFQSTRNNVLSFIIHPEDG